MSTIEDIILVFLVIDGVFWGLTLWRVLSLERLSRPWLNFLGRVFPKEPTPNVPEGAYGTPTPTPTPIPTPPSPPLGPNRRQFTSRGRLITAEKGADGKWRIIKNEPGPAAPAAGASGPVDLNELARKFGYSPEQVAGLVDKYVGPSNGGETSAPTASPTPTGVDVASVLLQRAMSGELSATDAAMAAPAVVKMLREANENAKRKASGGGSDVGTGGGRW